MIVAPLQQILAIYLATSLGAGLPLGLALGVMIRRAERRHRQHVAQLMRVRTRQTVGSFAEQTGRVGGAPFAMLTATIRSGSGTNRPA
jgi:hypothetical protein